MDAPMVDLTLKYLVEDRDRHGNPRIYFRRKGQRKVRIYAVPGSEEFTKAYAAALAGAPLIAGMPAPTIDAPKASLLWLCRKYMAESAEYKRLDPITRRIRKSHLERLCLEPVSAEDPTPVGTLPYADLPASKLRVLRDRIAHTPEAANSRIKAIRGVYAWAVPLDLATWNPAREVPKIITGSQGHHSWEVEEVQQFERRHPIGTKAYLALSIILFLGVRRSDAVAIGRPHIRRPDQVAENLRAKWPGRWIKFKVYKGRNRTPTELLLPIIGPLESVLEVSPCGELTFLETSFKKPFTAAGFGGWFRERCDEAGLHHCSAHGLRKAGSTIAAENGASAHTLKAIFGWKTLAEAERYTRAADQKRLAADGMHLLISDQSANKSVPLSPEVRDGGTIRAKKS